MATFSTLGADELADQLIRMGEATGDTAQRMIAKGAQELVQSWKEVITQRGHVETGAMRDSVKAGKIRDEGGTLAVEVYPQGKSAQPGRKKPVRNAEKAFVQHYGWKRKEGSHFVDEIEEKGGEKAVEAMTEVFDQYIESGGK